MFGENNDRFGDPCKKLGRGEAEPNGYCRSRSLSAAVIERLTGTPSPLAGEARSIHQAEPTRSATASTDRARVLLSYRQMRAKRGHCGANGGGCNGPRTVRRRL